MESRRRLALVAAAAIPLLGVVELALAVRFAKKAPTPADWSSAASRVAQLRAGADGVVVAPWWAEPHARKAFGEKTLPLRDVARPDASRYGALVEVSAVDQHLPELDGWRVRSEETVGPGLHARVLENPSPARVVTDFTDRVAEGRASALHRFPDHDAPCVWKTGEPVVATGLFGYPALPPSRFVCGAQPFLSVGATVMDDPDFRARRCIWSHPPAGGSVVVSFVGVALGSMIRGHLGIHATLDREKRGAPIDVDVAVDGDLVGTAHRADGDGWALFLVPLGAHAGATSARVDFTIRTSNANERHLCWEADSR